MKWVQELGKKKFKQKGGDIDEGTVEETAESGGEAPSQAEGTQHLPEAQQLPLGGDIIT